MVNIIKAIKIGFYGEDISGNHFPFNSILKLGKILVKVFKNYKKNSGKKLEMIQLMWFNGSVVTLNAMF